MSAFPTPSQYRRNVVAVCSTLAATLAVAAPASAGGVTAETVMGNPTCADVAAGLESVKIDPVRQGATTLAGRTITVQGKVLDWASTDPVTVVIAKGGPNATIYRYPGPVTSGAGLHAPTNPKNGQYYGLSHIDFCRDTSGPKPPPIPPLPPVPNPDPPVDPPADPPVGPPSDPCADGTCNVTPEPPTTPENPKKPDTPKKPVSTTIPSSGGVLGAKGVVGIRTAATIRQRKQCVSTRFTQVVTGKGIKRVTLTINGRVVGRMKGDGKRFTLSVDPAKFGSILRLSARAEFVKGSGRKAKTMRVTVLRCLQSRGIRFTG